MKCLECEKELINTEGKRAKKFCNNTCRSNYWQKQNRKNKPKGLPLPKDFIDHNGKISAVNQEGVVIVENIAIEQQIKEIEEKIRLVPKGQYYNQVVRGLRNQINKLKYNQ